ncbi:kinase-associated lipoprotein B [Caldifermentibacillus hisashii]|uniref:kinase-associated lipoprotein B n=1 Tax=Caldifermentibacillus hisashii TaxID=996558 RepID=UPI0031B6BA5E
MDTSIQIGSIVRANKKTGTYIGEVTAIKENDYLVRILAVIKHPMQGDLHHPKQADVPFFHERKALSYREQTPVPKNMVKLYDGEVPDYKESLKAAFDKLKSELEADDSLFAEKSLRCLEELAKEYF